MKPTKPYPTFPLTPHVRGGWQKRYKGKLLYLPDPDPDKALADFHRRARELDAGHAPAPAVKKHRATVGQIANRFVSDKMGEGLAEGTMEDYIGAAKEAARFLGRDLLVADLRPDMLSALARKWHKLGSHAFNRKVQAVRTMFRHAADQEWIPAVPTYGRHFKKRPVTRKRGRPFSSPELAALLDASDGIMRAFILVCANCAYTAKDCAALPVEALSGDVLVFPRPKMAKRQPIARAAVLWPETLAALQSLRSDSPLFFRGERGATFRTDVWCHHFRDLCKRVGIEKRGPSWIRHWCHTTAGELESPLATARMMGHRLPGMATVYVDSIEHSRLRAISDHLRKALIRLEPAPGDDWQI